MKKISFAFLLHSIVLIWIGARSTHLIFFRLGRWRWQFGWEMYYFVYVLVNCLQPSFSISKKHDMSRECVILLCCGSRLICPRWIKLVKKKQRVGIILPTIWVKISKLKKSIIQTKKKQLFSMNTYNILFHLQFTIHVGGLVWQYCLFLNYSASGFRNYFTEFHQLNSKQRFS